MQHLNNSFFSSNFTLNNNYRGRLVNFLGFAHQAVGQFRQFWPDLTACREWLNCNKYASLLRGGQYFYNDIPSVWLININEAHFPEDEGADKPLSVGQNELKISNESHLKHKTRS